jgi:GNAT superfamily N-acetyltransferase
MPGSPFRRFSAGWRMVERPARRALESGLVIEDQALADDEALLSAYDEQMRGVGNTGRPGLIIERDGPVLRAAGGHRGFVSGPRDLGVYGPDLDALIVRQREYFLARNEAVEWKTRGHDLPADLTDRLRAAGFMPEDQETVVIGVAAEIAADPVLPNAVTLREVTTDADLRAISGLESVVWDEDLSRMGENLIARRASDPDGMTFFAVTDDAAGQVVSAAWIIFHPGTDFAYLAGGSTLEAWRGRGIYRALVAVRAQRAVARGARYVMVDASDDSAPILRRLGFRAVTTTTAYVWTPGASG